MNDTADPLDKFIEQVEREEKAMRKRAAEIAETQPVPYHIVLGTLMQEARRGGAEKCLSYQGLDEIDLRPPERQ